MNVVLTRPVEIALRTLGPEDRRKVLAWLDALKNWDNDAFVRSHSAKLPSAENVYVLKTSTEELRLFFSIQDGTITVLDIATRPTILSSGSRVIADGKDS